ncbi:MAG TPA: hypothetical protein VFI59_05300 [Actinomycetota bacterium]|nr:hypothetical protein [Actinomycetota bacterium]
MEWLPLAVLGIMWVAFLLPTKSKASTPQGSVGDFERRMELLAQAESYGTEGRWIVTPRKGVRFMGPTERNRARARERRRQVFTFMLETIGITFLIGLVPPLRVAWAVTGVFAALLAVYVWLLLTIKHRESTFRTAPHRHPRSHAAPSRPVPQPRYVAEGRSTRARPSFNGLGMLGEGDRVHVVVRTGEATAGA